MRGITKRACRNGRRKIYERMGIVSWYDFYWEKDKGFRVGTRLFINAGESKLPPLDKSDSFFEFEIVSVWANTFNVKVIWNEIQSDSVWQIFTLPKTAEHLSKMRSSGEIFKVDKLNRCDWKASIDNIIKSKILRTWIFLEKKIDKQNLKIESSLTINEKKYSILEDQVLYGIEIKRVDRDNHESIQHMRLKI